jgi:hypothetical protein
MTLPRTAAAALLLLVPAAALAFVLTAPACPPEEQTVVREIHRRFSMTGASVYGTNPAMRSFDVTLQELRSALARMFAVTSFTGQEDALGLGPPFGEPVVLQGISYSMRLGGVTGHLVPGTDAPISFAFAVATPQGDVKERFLAELKKQHAGEPFDDAVIASYYTPFAPGRREFDAMVDGLTTGLDSFYESEGKPDRFVFHLACPTADWDFVLVFVEEASLMQVVLKG